MKDKIVKKINFKMISNKQIVIKRMWTKSDTRKQLKEDEIEIVLQFYKLFQIKNISYLISLLVLNVKWCEVKNYENNLTHVLSFYRSKLDRHL